MIVVLFSITELLTLLFPLAIQFYGAKIAKYPKLFLLVIVPIGISHWDSPRHCPIINFFCYLNIRRRSLKTLSLAKACLTAGFIIGLAPCFATAQVNCFNCHETTGCQTPTKQLGTCADCHLGNGDVDDYAMNFVGTVIDTTQWQNQGHGQVGISMDCQYCHDYDIGHGDPNNPFRLANTMAPGAHGQNATCLACHGTEATGFDPDNAGPLSTINSINKIDANHDGHKHDALTDGGYFCWDCHDPHGDSNDFMVHDNVTTESDGQFGIPASTAAVNFPYQSGNDNVTLTAPYNGICQVCHTSTKYWLNDGTLIHHNENTNCLACHEHQEGFQPNCNSCHGYPPVVNTPQGIDGLVEIPVPTGSATAGAHGLHVTDYGYNCMKCHFDGMPDTPIIDDYRIQMGFDILGFNGNGSIYNGQNLINGYSYNGTNGTIIGNGAATTCENIYCHSDGTAVSTSFLDPATFPGPHQSSPDWDGTTACNSCHEYGPSYPADQPKANVHGRHLDLFTNPLINYDENPCHFCHYSTTNDGITINNRANHVNRQYDVVPNTGAIYFQNTATPVPVNFTYTYSAGGGSCSSISCHQGIMNENETWGSSIGGSYSWSQASFCGGINFSINVTSGNAVPPFQYKIDWESDGLWDYEGPNSSHTHIYADPSTRYITYSASDFLGHTFSGDGTKISGPITPSSTNALPVVSVSPSVNGYTVTLTDYSYDPDYTTCGHSGPGGVRIDWRDGTIETPTLNLTDNTAGTGQQFTHTYSSGGNYSIRYYVYDNIITYPVTYTISPAVTVPQN